MPEARQAPALSTWRQAPPPVPVALPHAHAATSLAGDRRYLDLMRRIGLPPEHPSLDEFRSRGRIVFESSEASPPLTTGRRPR